MRDIICRATRLMLPVFCVFLFIFTLPTYAGTPTLSALVIGNSSYTQDQLPNPLEDAKLIAETLGGLGFTVTLASDLDRSSMFAAVRTFTDSLKPGAISVVYYAGHGMQINGGNYLIPVDMVPTSEKGVMLKAYPLENLMDRVKRTQSAVNIVILDACRNNPFRPKAKTRGFNNIGLAKVVAPRGTLIAYSTQPGQQAEDGAGGNSLYTKMLAQEMSKRGQNIEQVLKQVAEAVRKKTFDDQQPWFETSLVDEFYFSPPVGVQMVTRPQVARLSSNEKVSIKRGLIRDTNPDIDWFMNLNETEWSKLDIEINRRVKNATEDEMPLLEQRAKSGNVVAQTTLGLIYREGVEKTTELDTGRTFRSKPSNTKSLYWLQRAGDAGFAIAQVEIGEMYYMAQGVDRDIGLSEKWLEKAATKDYRRAKVDYSYVHALSSGALGDVTTEADRILWKSRWTMHFDDLSNR